MDASALVAGTMLDSDALETILQEPLVSATAACSQVTVAERPLSRTFSIRIRNESGFGSTAITFAEPFAAPKTPSGIA
jgi:hypothetical protein